MQQRGFNLVAVETEWPDAYQANHRARLAGEGKSERERADMSVHDVPPAVWADVLEQFSRGHHGWLATVEVVQPGEELHAGWSWRPLDSVTMVENGLPGGAIRIEFQDAPTLRVDTPRALRIDAENGAERALEIDGGGGEFVRLAFRATALPEELDGIAPAELYVRRVVGG